jgi:diazepam-binding inhibitor (GABA receptor modulating acyl-CoA-binding protein)
MRAWKKAVDESLPQKQAQEDYVKLVEKLKESYGYDPDKKPEEVGGK